MSFLVGAYQSLYCLPIDGSTYIDEALREEASLVSPPHKGVTRPPHGNSLSVEFGAATRLRKVSRLWGQSLLPSYFYPCHKFPTALSAIFFPPKLTAIVSASLTAFSILT